MTQIDTQKAVTYAAEIPELAIQSQKGVVYAVEMLELELFSEKVVTYAVEAPDNTGHARQFTSGNRPLYKSGAIPYISFATAGTSLEVHTIEDTSWLTIRLGSNGLTFTETVTTGSTVTIDQDFNQTIVAKDSTTTPVFRRLCRANMLSKL